MRLCEVITFTKGWDSYGGKPVDPSVGPHVVRWLSYLMESDTPIPRIIPVRDGAVQLEWHGPYGDLLVQISPMGAAEVYHKERYTGAVWTGPLLRYPDRVRYACRVISESMKPPALVDSRDC